MNEILPPFVACAFLMPLEAALLPILRLTTARADLPLCGVVFLAVGSATTLSGSVGAFAIGLLADILIPIHTGLFSLTGLLLFILLRLLPVGREVRGPVSFAVVVAVAAPVAQLTMLGLLWIVGQPLPAAPGWPIAQAALATALVAPLFYWLSGLVEARLTREDPSLLR